MLHRSIRLCLTLTYPLYEFVNESEEGLVHSYLKECEDVPVHVELHRKDINYVIICNHTHIPVDSSAARMPFPGATILWAMSCSSFFCSEVSAGYWWVMMAERERETEIWRRHIVSISTTDQHWPPFLSVLSLQCGYLAVVLSSSQWWQEDGWKRQKAWDIHTIWGWIWHIWNSSRYIWFIRDSSSCTVDDMHKNASNQIILFPIPCFALP